MIEVYRVQSADGRGPWKPGLSKHWIDADSTIPLQKDVIAAFGLKWRDEIPKSWHCGCACRSIDALSKWFTPIERSRLSFLGYVPVMMNADKIIRENEDQVIFARKRPLNEGFIVVPWGGISVPVWKMKKESQS